MKIMNPQNKIILKTAIEKIKKLSQEYLDEIIQIRREIHQNPELSKEEFRTMELICRKLEEWKIPYQNKIAETGVVALIEGEAGAGKTIALRADMDALPLVEKNTFSFVSNKKGVMHACGHDMHTASLLGTAKILQALRSELKGKVKLIFQPSEEVLPGGAKPMIEAGVLQNPDVEKILGQHVFPDLEVGEVGVRKGAYMASSDEIYLKVLGKGGHAALPDKFVNPLIISSKILIALQELGEKYSDKDNPAILTFGRIVGDGQMNLVPDEVNISGILRTFDENKRKELKAGIIQISKIIAQEMQGECDVKFEESYPVLVNNVELTEAFEERAKEYLGKDKVKELPLRATTEDFAHYSHEIPAVFYRFGVGTQAGSLHSSYFNPDEKSLETSVGLMAYLAWKELVK
jgi:amidohydrolase